MKLHLNQTTINKYLAGFIACVAIYASIRILPEVPDLYHGWLTFFTEPNSIYPLLITIVTALVPFSIFAIAYFVLANKRTLLIPLGAIHSVMLFASYPVLAMLVLLVVWWYSKNRIQQAVKGMNREYITPIIFAFLTAGYFSPFYLPIVGGEASGIIFGLILILWLLYFISIWLITLIRLVTQYKRGGINKHNYYSAIITAVIYLLWFILGENGYYLTV